MEPTIDIVAMAPADADGVLAIFAEALLTGQASFETEAPSWAAWDAAHLADCRLAAHSRDTLVGWAALSSVSSPCAYAGVAEVSVYVAAPARGQGVGRELLRHLVAASEAAGLWTLQASIFPENVASVRLHERCGFRVVGRRERIGQLHGVWRDTLLLERRSPTVGAS